jgi:tetraacyldisaccharide 4'-kinase
MTDWLNSKPSCILKPLSHFWGWLMKVRAEAYEAGLLPSHKASCPVISIGNLTVGGNGKTPMTLWLAQTLAQDGYQVAILTRGYGRKKYGLYPDPLVVSRGDGPEVEPIFSGDEPYLLAQSSKAIVICSKKRFLAAEEAVRLGANILLLDDGFQHLSLKRQINILLMAKTNPFGNGYCLPSGPLREPKTAYLRADLVILFGTGSEPDLQEIAEKRPFFRAHSRIKGFRFLNENTIKPLNYLEGQKVAAFCGLARPDLFRQSLMDLNLNLTSFKAFKDHQSYGPDEFYFLKKLKKQSGASYLLTTAKDAVKLGHKFPDILVVETEFFPENGQELKKFLDQKLRSLS